MDSNHVVTMDEELEQLRKFYRDVQAAFLAPAMTPFKICKVVWRLIGQMSRWYAEQKEQEPGS